MLSTNRLLIQLIFTFLRLEDCLETERLEDVAQASVELAHELHPEDKQVKL